MNDFKLEFKKFLSKYKYITESEYLNFLSKYKNELNKTFYNQLICEKNKYIKLHNELFLDKVLKNKKEYFDNMFKNKDSNIKLDNNQLRAIIIDDNLLVIAGAGAGKTTTMAAKVKYLVDSGYKESEILVVSFTRASCEEIGDIIHNTLGCPNVKVVTFHSLGLDLIKKSGRDIDKIIDDNYKYKIISYYIKNVAFKDKEYMQRLLNCFKSFISSDVDEFIKYDDFDEFHKNMYGKRYIKTGFDLENYNNLQISNRKKRKKTIKGEFLRSQEEVDIANFLYMNGIDYEYEMSFKDIKNNVKTHPDFYIKQLELENYIEHFGVDENLDNSMYDEKNLKGYLNSLNLKCKYINEKDVSKKFIITYSHYKNKNENYISSLNKQLIKLGYVYNKRSQEEVFDMLMKTDTEGYFSKFIYDIVIQFISIFKRNNYQEEDFDLLKKNNNALIGEQLDVLKRIYDYYQKTLAIKHYIDFDDMINLAYNIIPSLNERMMGVDYKYLIIDEYQDISIQRYNLTSRLAKLFDAKVMAVGDDWQAIYSFAGADISLFRDFVKYVEHAQSIPIKNTYRNSQELIDIAGKFIEKNKYQIKKSLKSTKHLVNPVEIYYYEDDRCIIEDYACAKAISIIISKIMANNPEHKILILGRYNKDKDMLLYTDYFYEYRGKIKSRVDENAKITFLTVHMAKGLGYDDVILINGADKLYGFPSKIEDKPIIKILKNNSCENILYPEERRLFYVAMTRTKNKFYITVPSNKRSIFIREISKYNNVLEHKEIIRNDSIIKTNYKCPKCNYRLNMVNYKNVGFYIYVCDNNKCNFKTMFPKKLEELENCPKCGEIVTYRYTNNNDEKVYKCISKDCDYVKIKH